MRNAIAVTIILAALPAAAAAYAEDAPAARTDAPKAVFKPAVPPQAADGAAKPSPVHTLQKALQSKGFKAPQTVGNLCAEPPKPRKGKPPFGAGETVYYLVTVKDIPVGKVVLKIDGIRDRGGRKIMHTTARGKTNSFFSKINKVKAFIEDDVDTATLLPVGFHEDVAEKDVPRDSVYTFDREKGKVRVRSKFNGRDLDNSVQASKYIHDFMSALYHVRSLTLQKGQGICFEVVYFKYVWKATGAVIGRERIQTPAGFFNTIVIDGTAVRTDDKNRTRRVTFWLTDDQYRIPVKASTNLQMGETAIYASYIKRAGKAEGEGIAEEAGQEEGGE